MSRYFNLSLEEKISRWETNRTCKSGVQGIMNWLLKKHAIHGRAIINTGPAVADCLAQFPQFKKPLVPESDNQIFQLLRKRWSSYILVENGDFWDKLLSQSKKFSFIYFDGMQAPNWTSIQKLSLALLRRKLKSPGAIAITFRGGKDRDQPTLDQAEGVISSLLEMAKYSVIEFHKFPYKELIRRNPGDLRKNRGHPMRTDLWIVK